MHSAGLTHGSVAEHCVVAEGFVGVLFVNPWTVAAATPEGIGRDRRAVQQVFDDVACLTRRSEFWAAVDTFAKEAPDDGRHTARSIANAASCLERRLRHAVATASTGDVRSPVTTTPAATVGTMPFGGNDDVH